jgi:ATP-dependent Lhr-like helicase
MEERIAKMARSYGAEGVPEPAERKTRKAGITRKKGF